MNIARIFASAFVRRIAYAVAALVLGALASLVPSAKAHAQACPPALVPSAAVDFIDTHPSRQEALAHCEAVARGAPNLSGGSSYYNKWLGRCELKANGSAYGAVYEQYSSSTCQPRFPDNPSITSRGTHGFTVQCPDGGEWRDDLKRCFDPSECNSRNGAANGFPDTPRSLPYESRCLDGCDFRMNASSGQCMSILQAPDSKMCTGSFQFSGNTCSVPPDQGNTHPDEEAEAGSELCSPIGPTSGLVACVKPGQPNQECIGTPKGAMICWGTGETGSKVTGNEQQTRGPGTTEPTPTPPMPPETFDPSQKSEPVTTTTTSSTTTTTVTTVTNGTTNGTIPPGTPGFGPQPGSPDISDMEGSASGGSDCTQPVVTTGDPVMGMVARQAWETRCAVEKSAKVSVSGDIANCKSPFSVQGPADDENVQQMKAMRAQICPGEADTDAETGDGDAIDHSGIDGPDSAEGSGLFVTEEIGEEGLDTGGLGFSRSCPAMPQVTVFGSVIQFDNSVMCDWLRLGGQILLVLAALASVRIMAGVGT